MVKLGSWDINLVSRVFWIILGVAQLIMMTLFFVFGEYSQDTARQIETYTYFKDVSVMIVVGFGYLMMFLKKYGYGAIAFTYLVAAFSVQLTILYESLFGNIYSGDWIKTQVNVTELLQGLFGAAVVLITLGGIIGKSSPEEILIITIVELFFYALNNYIVLDLLQVQDVGGSIVIHSFGAVFGLIISFIISPKHCPKVYELNVSVYHSDLLAMVGTTFLWIYWPSFNASSADVQEQPLVVSNTVLSLCGSTVITFIFSRLYSFNGKYFSMVDIQNATLAGGVAVGAVSNFNIGPGGAIAIGILSGFISVTGYHHTQPLLAAKIDLQDTCGIQNLHCFPGIFGGLASILMCGIIVPLPFHTSRSAWSQAGYQAIGLAVTIGMALVSGALCGGIILGIRKLYEFVENRPEKTPEEGEKMVSIAPEAKKLQLFADEVYFETPDDYEDEQKDCEHPQNLRNFQSGLLSAHAMQMARELLKSKSMGNIQQNGTGEKQPIFDRRSTFKRT